MAWTMNGLLLSRLSVADVLKQYVVAGTRFLLVLDLRSANAPRLAASQMSPCHQFQASHTRNSRGRAGDSPGR